MKKIYSSITFFILTGTLLSQNSAPTEQWFRYHNGQTSENETVVKSVKDNNGYYYVLSNTGDDAVIAKFDNSGAAINSFRYNEASNNTNSSNDIDVDANGNIYQCGSGFVTSYWNTRQLVVKMNANGTVLWEQNVNSVYYTHSVANALAIDVLGNVYFVGSNSDSLSVGLISAAGVLLWNKNICPAGYGIGEAFDVAVDAGSHAYVTGKIKNIINDNYDYITFKIDQAGTVAWTKLLNGAANADDEGDIIKIDGSSNAYVMGLIADSSASNTDVLLIKYNASGGQQWVKKLHEVGQTLAAVGDLYVDGTGNSYAASAHGFSNNTTANTHVYKFSNTGTQVFASIYNDATYTKTVAVSIVADVIGNVFIGGTKIGSQYDMFISKFNSTGTFLWTANYSSYWQDIGRTVHVDSGNNAVIAGKGSGTGTTSDATLAKYSSSGVFQWEGFYNGQGNPDDKNIKVFTQNNSSVYTLGYTGNESSGTDVITTKYDPQGNVLWQNIIDFSGDNNMARGMSHDADFNIAVLADNSYGNSAIQRYDSIGSPIYTTTLTNGLIYKSIQEDGAGNVFVAGGVNPTAFCKDFAVAKLDPAGNVLFENVPATANNYQTDVVSHAIDNNGRSFVLGSVVYNDGINPKVGRIQVQRFGAVAGNLNWSIQVTGIDSSTSGVFYYCYAKKLLLDGNSNSYILIKASTGGSTDFLPIVIKYDVSGNEIWRQTLNGNDAIDMIISGGNLIILTQLLGGTADLYSIDRTNGGVNWEKQVSYGGHYLSPTALYENNDGNLFLTGRGFSYSYEGDFFLIKTDSAGTYQWGTTYGGRYSGNDVPYDLVVTNNNRIFVVGGLVMSNGTNTDAGIVKFCDISPNVLSATGNPNNICPGNSVTLYAGNAAAYTWNVAGHTSDTLNANSTGSYFCTTFKSDGCWKNTDTISVTIKNPPSAPSICQVTVDTSSQHNIIYWDKTLITGADSVRIYREDVTNVYSYIGAVSMDSLSEFQDNVANPNVTTKRYKISAMDSCGNESALSLYHNTIYIIYNGLGQFSWNPLYTIENSANPVNNYILMRDDISDGNWHQVASTAGTQNTIVDTGYINYPNGRWRVETTWNISCDPTRAIINTSRSNIKSQLAGPTLGIEENQITSVSFAPNPFNQSTQIDIRTQNGKVNFVFELYDETGRIVRTEQVTAPKFVLDREGLDNGIYFYRLVNKSSRYVARSGKLIITQ